MFRLSLILCFIVSVLHNGSALLSGPLSGNNNLPENLSGGTIDLAFEFNEDKVLLKNVWFGNENVIVNSTTTSSETGMFSIIILDDQNHTLYKQSFRDPRIKFYDSYDALNKNLTGGYYLSDQAMKKIRIPNIKNAKSIYMTSPENLPVFQSRFSDIISFKNPSFKHDTYQVDTLLFNGSTSNRIDMLFMGDGYTGMETAQFREIVMDYISEFLALSPFGEYRSYFNFFLIQVISAERGADHPDWVPPVYKNTAFDATYNCANILRLICVNTGTVFSVANSAAPFYDNIMVFVNDPTYGGSGGTVQVRYNGSAGGPILTHEFGHSFGRLMDEYSIDPSPGLVSGCNCDDNNVNPQWQPWINIGSPGVGAYAGCTYVNLYRPTNNACMMYSGYDPFCVVCQEQIVRKINEGLGLYDDYYPASSAVIPVNQPTEFGLSLLQPYSHSLITHWYVEGVLQSGSGPGRLIFQPSSTGMYQIKAMIYDSSDFVLSDPAGNLRDEKTWSVQAVNSTDISDQGSQKNIFLSQNYPNPFNPSTLINYELKTDQWVTLKVYNIFGQEVETLIEGKQAQGHHRVIWNGKNKSGYVAAAGIYLYQLKAGAEVLTRKMILIK